MCAHLIGQLLHRRFVDVEDADGVAWAELGLEIPSHLVALELGRVWLASRKRTVDRKHHHIVPVRAEKIAKTNHLSKADKPICTLSADRVRKHPTMRSPYPPQACPHLEHCDANGAIDPVPTCVGEGKQYKEKEAIGRRMDPSSLGTSARGSRSCVHQRSHAERYDRREG
jgi:hypothetical protein